MDKKSDCPAKREKLGWTCVKQGVCRSSRYLQNDVEKVRIAQVVSELGSAKYSPVLRDMARNRPIFSEINEQRQIVKKDRCFIHLITVRAKSD